MLSGELEGGGEGIAKCLICAFVGTLRESTGPFASAEPNFDDQRRRDGCKRVTNIASANDEADRTTDPSWETIAAALSFLGFQIPEFLD
jgi:hypothetical protein